MNVSWEELLELEDSHVKKIHKIEGFGWIVEVEANNKEAVCPRCGRKSRSLHQNHYSLARDLPICGQDVWLRINRRQFKCSHCKRPFSQELSLVEKKKYYTKRMAYSIVEQVLASGNIKKTGELNDLTEEEVSGMLKDLAGKILPQIEPGNIKRLGIDEIALRKGHKNYIVVLVDLEINKPIAFVNSRVKEDVGKVLESWGEKVLTQIQEVSIDLYKSYKILTEELMPQAEVIADRFHVMNLLNKELDEARRQEKNQLEKIKSKSKREKMKAAISKSKYALLKNQKELSETQEEKLTIVLKSFPRLAEKHALKEEFKLIFDKTYDCYSGASKIADWLEKARSHYPKFIGTLKRWFAEIVGYFENRTTNGIVEGINNKLKVIKRAGYGFKNYENFKMRCLLNWHFGYPN